MHRKEINERSPVRVLEASIRGGLGPGKIGVVIARHGVGKTAFLVGVALDDLMRGRMVLHVSLEQDTEKVRGYYDEIFMDLAHERELGVVALGLLLGPRPAELGVELVEQRQGPVDVHGLQGVLERLLSPF